MCTVSAVSDQFLRSPLPPMVSIPPLDWYSVLPSLPQINSLEVQQLKAEIEVLKRQLKEARRQDIEEGNPDCEMAEKVDIIKDIAKSLGVDLEDVFSGHK